MYFCTIMPPELSHKTREELAWEVVRLREELERAKSQSDYLCRMLFGKKSERFVPQEEANTPQMRMDFSGEEAVAAQATETPLKQQITYERTKPAKKITPHGRSPLPAHLEREDIIIEPSDLTDDMVKIGEDITEVLEIIEAKMYVKRYIRPRYARPKGEGVVQVYIPVYLTPLFRFYLTPLFRASDPLGC